MIIMAGGGATDIWWVEAGHAAKLFTVHPTAPPRMILLQIVIA